MKKLIFFVGISILLTSGLSARKKSYGAMIIGQSTAGPLVARSFTNKFRKAGGLQELKVKSWNCKGWLAASYGRNGSIGNAWCCSSQAEARAGAAQVCAKYKGTNYTSMYTINDR